MEILWLVFTCGGIEYVWKYGKYCATQTLYILEQPESTSMQRKVVLSYLCCIAEVASLNCIFSIPKLSYSLPFSADGYKSCKHELLLH